MLTQQDGQGLDKRRETQVQPCELTPLYNYYGGVQGQLRDLTLLEIYNNKKTDRQPPRYTAGLSGRRSPAVAHRPKADSQDSRQIPFSNKSKANGLNIGLYLIKSFNI